MTPKIPSTRLHTPAAFETHKLAEQKLDEAHARAEKDSFTGWVATRYDPTMPRRRVSISVVPLFSGIAAARPSMRELQTARAEVMASKAAVFQAVRTDLEALPHASPADKQQLAELANDPELLALVMRPKTMAELETRSMLLGVAEALS